MIKLLLKDFSNDNDIYHAKSVIRNTDLGESHTHDFYEIFFVESGQLNYTINNQSMVMFPGDLQLVLPANHHYFSVQEGNFCSLMNIAFSPDLLSTKHKKMIQSLLNIHGFIHVISLDKSILITIKSLYRYLSVTNDKSKKIQLLDTILTNYFMGYHLINPLTQTTLISPPMWLQQSLLTILENDNFLNGLDFFIQLSEKSQEHFTRSFKKYYYQTPTQLLNKLRMTYAADLLKNSKKSILTIMLDAGFNNVSYFNRLFKEQYRCTPRDYRKQSYDILCTILHKKNK